MTAPKDRMQGDDQPRGDWGGVYLEIVDDDEDGEGFTDEEARRFMERPAADVGRSSAREGA